MIVARLDTPFTSCDASVQDLFLQAGSIEFDVEVIDRVRELATFAPVVVDVGSRELRSSRPWSSTQL